MNFKLQKGFTKTTYALIKDKFSAELLGHPAYGLYDYLRGYICRAEKYYKGHIDIYKDYYCKGLLASRWGIERLADHFSKSKSTISRQLQSLEDLGYIKIDKVKVANKVCNIYILGRILENGSERLYWEDKVLDMHIKHRAYPTEKTHRSPDQF